jgi:hypothetical protein
LDDDDDEEEGEARGEEFTLRGDLGTRGWKDEDGEEEDDDDGGAFKVI